MPLIPFSSPQIHYGKGSLKVLKTFRGKKALIITDKVLREIGIVDKVLKHLNKSKEPMEIKIFDEVEENPAISTIIKGTKIARENNIQLIIGLGGGSSMDAAKGIAAFAPNKGNVNDYLEGKVLSDELNLQKLKLEQLKLERDELKQRLPSTN